MTVFMARPPLSRLGKHPAWDRKASQTGPIILS
jgi:hypothetical protein